MKKVISTLWMVLFLTVFGQGQEFCGTMERLRQMIAENPALKTEMAIYEEQLQEMLASQGDMLKSATATVTIPVVVHIVYHTAAQNIPDEQVFSQMDVLNNDFTGQTVQGQMLPFPTSLEANCEIKFCLAKRDPRGNLTTGIERRYTDTVVFKNINNVKFYAKGGLDGWDPYRYLNIWVDSLGSGLLGIAQFPSRNLPVTYGTIVHYKSFGTIGDLYPQYNQGAVATHELGHCFSCYHIWGDDGTECTGTDYCNDTPNQAGRTLDPSYPGVVITDACTSTSPGIMYMDFMDYSRDAWKHNFTPDQKARMQALFQRKGFLFPLTTSDGCVPPVNVCLAPGDLRTTDITNSSATLNWGAVPSAISYHVQYRVAGGTWITGSTAVNTLVIAGLAEGSNYEWQVQTQCDGGTLSAWSGVTTFSTPGVCAGINAFEPNATQATAALIPTGVALDAGITSATDVDWFKFSNNGSQKRIKVEVYDLPADYDVKLFTSNGAEIGVSQNSGTMDEKIIYNTGKVGTYSIKIYGHNGSYNGLNCYTLKVSLNAVNFTAMTDGTPASEPNTPVLFLVYPNPAHGSVTVEYNSAADGVLHMGIYNVLGSKLEDRQYVVQKGLNTCQPDISRLIKGIYLLDLSCGEDRTIIKLMVE